MTQGNFFLVEEMQDEKKVQIFHAFFPLMGISYQAIFGLLKELAFVYKNLDATYLLCQMNIQPVTVGKYELEGTKNSCFYHTPHSIRACATHV